MGWRDVQAKVQSGELDYSPEENTFGEAFASAVNIISNKWISDADAAKKAKLEQEKEDRKARREAEKERKEADKLDQTHREAAKSALTMARIPWSQKAENSAYNMIKGGSTVQQVTTFLLDGVKSGVITYDLREQQGPMPGITQTDQLFKKYESGSGGADALLNQAQNSQFAGVKVSQMPIGEVLAFQLKRGPGSYHDWSKANMPKNTLAYQQGLGSTPVGIFQFVGETLKGLKDSGVWEELGITDDTIFSKDVQKQLFVRLAQERLKGKTTPEEQVAAMRGTWEGLKGAPDSEVLEVVKAIETGTFGDEVEVEGPRTGMEGGFMIAPATKAAVDISPFIEAINEPKDLTKQIALIDANTTMSPSDKENAKRKLRQYVTGLPSSQLSNEDLAKMELKDLQGMAALLEKEIAAAPAGQFSDKKILLDRISTVIGAKDQFDITKYDGAKDATLKTKIADPNTPEDERVQLEALLLNRGDKPFKLMPGSPSYVTSYDILDENGEVVSTEITTTMLTENGEHVDLSKGEIIPAAVIKGQPINREEQRELASNFAQINTPLLKPLKEARTNMVLAVQSAKKLSDIVERNPDVQTIVGGKVPKLLKDIGLEIAATDDLLFGGVNEGEFNAQINKFISQSEVGKSAGDTALYYAELYKFAFVYASSRLGQSGQGLSNKDFLKALEIVAAGKGQTFITNIKSQTKEIVQIADNAIKDFTEDGSIKILDSIDPSQELLSGYKQTPEEFANSRGFGDAYAFVMSETQPTSTPPQNSPTLQQFIERTKQRNPGVDISEMTIGGLSVEEYWKQNYGGEN